jgi:non-ribosomal peptide synthetase component E (peptide arylation enzyme)
MTRIDDHRAAEMTRAGWWRNESLDQYLDRWATKRPGKTALMAPAA